jgi:hypothetical protein
VVCLAVASFLLLVGVGQVDGVLRDMHPKDGTAYGFGDLSGVPLLSYDESRPGKVVSQWHDYDTGSKTGGEFASSRSIVHRYLAFDAAFMVAYSLLAVALLLRWKPPEDGPAAAGPNASRLRFLERKRRPAFRVVAALLALDALEDLLGYLAVHHIWQDDWAYRLAVLATSLKWALVILLVGYLAVLWSVRGLGHHVRRAVRAMTAPIVVLIAYGLLLFYQEQTVDLIRRWPLTENWLELVAALLTAVWMALVLAAVGRQSGYRASKTQNKTIDRTAVAVMAIAGLVLIAFGIWRDALGLCIPGAALVVVAITERALEDSVNPPTELEGRLVVPEAVRQTTGAALAAIALALLAGGIVRAGTADFVLDVNRDSAQILLAALLVGGIAVAVWLALSSGGRLPEASLPGDAAIVVSFIGSAVVAVVSVADPIGVDSGIGTVAVVQVFLVLVLGVVYGATLLRETTVPPRVLLLIGVTRIPVLLSIVAWVAVASLINNDHHHDVRLLTSTNASARGSTIQDDFGRWAAELPPLQSGDGSQRAVPLVLVAAEGGGIRAAYWTSIVMDCLFSANPALEGCGDHGSDRRPYLFLGSGASGGSVGLASYSAWSIDSRSGDPPTLRDEMSRDFVAPTVAQAVFVDLPQAFTASDWGDDRAAVLERDWEDASGDKTFRKGIFALGLDHPLLLLNGTDVQDGCRVNVSTLHAAVGTTWSPTDPSSTGDGWEVGRCEGLGTQRSPSSFSGLSATDDVADYLCTSQDLSLSTAAFLSARFPWVSPHGRLPACHSTGAATTAEIVDGGYLDNSGASPIVELWPRISALIDEYNAGQASDGRCLVPVFVQIDNHYARTVRPDPKKRTLQALGPLTALFGVRDAHDSEARQAAEGLFQKTGWVTIHPLAHPGPEAPLGWALSSRSMKDLEDEVVDQNREALDQVDGWFAGGLSCPEKTG